jgi:DNA polymerase III delta subunit
VIIYNVLKKGQSYQELGEDYQDKQPDKERLARRLLKRLEKLGVKVTLAAQEAVA